jgi:hypothetical protein
LGDRDNLSPKTAVRVTKLWPWNLEWNRHRQWKRINEMRIATWNIHTLYRAMNELVKEMGKYEIDICTVKEIVARERNCDNTQLYDFI